MNNYGRWRRLDCPTCLCTPLHASLWQWPTMRQEVNTRMPTRSRLLLLRFSVCATISIVVAAASDANAGAQANVDIGLHLHGITPSCRTRFVGSRPTNENVSMILFGSNKNKKWDQEGLFFTASFNHGDFCVTSNAYYFVCHQPD